MINPNYKTQANVDR